jgi:hypothetical protein
MSTQYYTAASVDGFIATVDHSLDWLFPLGDVNDTSYPKFILDNGRAGVPTHSGTTSVRP